MEHNIEIAKLERKIRLLEGVIERNKITEVTKKNIHELRTVEQQRLHRYMNLLLDNTPNVILMFDVDRKLQFCTDIFLKKIHLPSFDLIRNLGFKEVFALFADADFVGRIERNFSRVMNDKASVLMEESADFEGAGTPRSYQISISPMADIEGVAEGAIVIFHDVTEEKVMRESALKASSAKSDFLANMSHEMRTPMNAIIGMTSIAAGTGDVERKDYCLGKISDAATHLLGIINDVLDMSKIEANKLELSYHDFNFEKMMMKISTVLAFTMSEKNIDFTVKIDPAIPAFIHSDEQRLSQVITNFLSNAAKFTPEGGAVRLAANRVGSDDENALNYIRISVNDTGIGISDEQMEKLFTSFEQGDNSISRKYGGTGLGLAISKRIVELMSGTLSLDSAVGQGSTFSFIIPVKRGADLAQTTLPKGVGWNNLSVLAVDDSEETREYFQATAEALGFRCDTARDGFEAIEMLNEPGAHYDVIFADWKMPGMNGIELTKRIKGAAAGPVVVIMISSTEWSEIADDAKKAGVDGFIPKPLFTSQLTDCINNCLNLGGAAAEDVEETANKSELAGVRILLAEDVDINREIVHGLLEDTGVIITEAENGVEAVEKFKANPDGYDLIFMDIHMPIKDGYAATREIRAMEFPKAKTIPIIAMTANVFRKDIDKCLAAGMNDHVGKPIDIEQL
ncbi:MAG: response regulator, partial [Clostridiales Family XIII bacterium]|nr:response regulator [Clostridiales Family XIII bacterium]